MRQPVAETLGVVTRTSLSFTFLALWKRAIPDDL